MIGAAARLPSPWAAFSRDFFGLGAAAQAGAGASWFRPLTTLSFALDLKGLPGRPAVRPAPRQPALAHARHGARRGRAPARYAPRARRRSSLAGLLLVLGGAPRAGRATSPDLRPRRRDGPRAAARGARAAIAPTHALGRAAVIASATALALLGKESFVAAPIVVAVDLALRVTIRAGGCEACALAGDPRLGGDGDRLPRLSPRAPSHSRRRRGHVLRGSGSPIALALALESLGHALIATVIRFEAHRLRARLAPPPPSC